MISAADAGKKIGDFIDVHLVERPFRRLTAYVPTVRRMIIFDFRFLEIPINRAVAPNDLARAAIVTLDKIEVDVRDDPAIMANEDLSQAFHREANIACLKGGGPDHISWTEVPKGQIDFVNAIKNRSATLRRRCAVALMVIRARPPVRQIGS